MIPISNTDPAFDGLFLENANKNGLLNLKGHRSVGGMRQYIMLLPSNVNDLIDFMDDFEKNNYSMTSEEDKINKIRMRSMKLILRF